jgi:hypothetical protein
MPRGVHTCIGFNKDSFVIAGYTQSDFNGEACKGGNDALIVKMDNDGNILWSKTFGGSGDDVLRGIVLMPNDTIIVGGYMKSTDAGFENKGDSDGVIIKYSIKFPIPPESKDVDNEMYIAPKNVLEISLNTTSIVFDDFSILEPCEKLNALELTVSSSLSYNLSVTLDSDIVGQNKGKILDSSIVNIKLSTESFYKNFSNNQKKLYLAENQVAENDIVYGIDLKVADNKITIFDIYKTVLKFEVEQI